MFFLLSHWALGQLSPSDQADLIFITAQMRIYRDYYRQIEEDATIARKVLCADIIRATHDEFYSSVESTASRQRDSAMNNPWLFEKYCSPRGYPVAFIAPLWSLLPLDTLFSSLDVDFTDGSFLDLSVEAVMNQTTKVDSNDATTTTLSGTTTTSSSTTTARISVVQIERSTEAVKANENITISASLDPDNFATVVSPPLDFVFSPRAPGIPTINQEDLEDPPAFNFTPSDTGNAARLSNVFTVDELTDFFPDGLEFEFDDGLSPAANAQDMVQKLLQRVLTDQAARIEINNNSNDEIIAALADIESNEDKFLSQYK
eukprot:GHVH01001635.1.p1 GENE.GHVH01001635.1~~GHVH01001635.1.p1  ORF type:complete len:317 (+),score=52.35 GHVH01001635.1:118-1068(+)